MKLTVNFIDAFTAQAFKGNPAAVIVLDSWLSDGLMQNIAMENNLSETAFLVKKQSGVYFIRWFSPLAEIDFCGHATLASSFVLFKQEPQLSSITFLTKQVGDITVNQASDGYIEMSFPQYAPVDIDDIPEVLTLGLSIKPEKVLRNQQAYFVIYPHENDVLNVISTSEQIKKLAPYDVIVTAKAQSTQYDFVSRYFWPANGGDEDPVTGSAHAGLAPYWSKVLGKKELNAYQASARGGYLRCQIFEQRVIVSGQAVQYLEGEITI